MNIPTQEHMFYTEQKKISDRDKHVMDLIHDRHNPLTAADLHQLADRWPDRYSKYRNLLDKKD